MHLIWYQKLIFFWYISAFTLRITYVFIKCHFIDFLTTEFFIYINTNAFHGSKLVVSP